MNEGLISQRYAKALFRYAKELGVEELVYEKMKLFLENYEAYPDLQKALLNPVLSPRDKELLLSTAIGIEPGEAYIRAIRLLIKNHRESYLRTIAFIYEDIYLKANGIIRVNIITAQELAPAVMEKIQKLVTEHTSRQVEFSSSIDPQIIGGFILKIGSEQLDASVRKELKQIRSALLNV